MFFEKVKKAKNAQVTIAENPQIKINSLKKQKRGYIFHT